MSASVLLADPLSVACPFCHAITGQWCLIRDGLRKHTRKCHAARRKLALVLAAHAEYEVTVEVVEVISEWAKRWPGAWK